MSLNLETFVGFGGAPLSAERFGFEDDPSVLLIPGLTQTAEVWRGTARALVAAGRYVLALDLRGHGASARPQGARYDFKALTEDIRCVLSQMGSRPVIVGASTGGWIAAAALKKDAANLASGLVLADSVPDLDSKEAGRILDRLRDEARRTDRDLKWDPSLLEQWDGVTNAREAAEAAEHITLPVMLVRGASSLLTQEKGAVAFAERFPSAEFREITDAGHLVALDRSEEFNAALLNFLEREAPRELPSYKAGSDTRMLRDALGCFATGVTVITALPEGGDPVGFTANSFTSVSLDPPMVLACANKTSSSLTAIEAAGYFAINVLHIGQQDISNIFAKPIKDRFAHVAWRKGAFGPPILSSALASFECAVCEIREAGDHVILLGDVKYAHYDSRRDPLLYFKGKYRRLNFA